jgi:3-deoxy-D-manno-octulosonate 8-phosphate phosphatase (KDO 8-P phosphatase)
MSFSHEELQRRLSKIRLVALDVDGVLTDGRLILSSSGDEAKSFNIRDGLGIVLAQKAGLHVAFVSGRRSMAVDRRANELGVPEHLVASSVKDKARAMRELRSYVDVSIEEVAFVGDDLNDLPAFAEAGVSAAVADAAQDVKDQADLLLTLPGGGGAARELIEMILRAQGLWEEGVNGYLKSLRAHAAVAVPH